MAVTKQTYTAAATWTASQLADIFRDAFIDAGLMAAWYDSFANAGIENRILEITYNGAKTYGKTYYWFVFSTTRVGVSVATAWSAATDVPTGTQYLDFYSNATNTTANHVAVGPTTLSTATSAVLVRYTNSGYSWFSFRNGATPSAFFIAPASTTIASWIDLDKVFFHHFIFGIPAVSASTGASRGSVNFRTALSLRRSYFVQGALRGVTAFSEYIRTYSTLGYVGWGNTNAGVNILSTNEISEYVAVPYGFNNANPAYTTNYTPVINGYSYSNYTGSIMPADFGVYFDYSTTTFAFGDRIVVSAGVEEWEVYAFANNTDASSASALIVARVV